MLKNLSKKTKIIIIVVHVVTIAILALAVSRLIWVGDDIAQELSYVYTRDIGTACEYMNDITETLEKAKYVNTATGQFAVVAQLQTAAQGAKTAVSNLPFSAQNSEKLEQSLSVISDFSYYIERKISSGESISEQDENSLQVLAEHSLAIQAELNTILEKLGTGDLSIEQTESVISQSLNLPNPPSFEENMGDLTEQLSTLPSVEYDGAFSSHIETKEAVFLIDKEQITQEQALQKAAEFLQVPQEELVIKYESEGAIAEYQIISADSTVNVTKLGGEISYFKKTLSITENNLSYEQALEKAENYLNQAGYENICETSFVINDNICTINFVSVQDGVLLYPDLLTISIELGEGAMMEFSSKGFLYNSTQRDNLTPEISKEQAQQSIKENLEVTSCNLAIIPTAGQKEVLTYEFNLLDKDTNQKLLIYINSSTGLEEQIYLLYD